jgi:hypothetical protein
VHQWLARADELQSNEWEWGRLREILTMIKDSVEAETELACPLIVVAEI